MKSSKFIISQKDVVGAPLGCTNSRLQNSPPQVYHKREGVHIPPKWNENHLQNCHLRGYVTSQDATLKTEIARLKASLSLHAHEFKSTTPLPDFASISWIQNAFLHPFCHFHPFPWKKISFTGSYAKIDSEKTSALFLDFRPFAMLKAIARAETPANSSSSLVSRSESAPGGMGLTKLSKILDPWRMDRWQKIC